MTTRLYYLLALLPPLPALGEKPGISFPEIRRLMSVQDGRSLVEIIDIFIMEEQLQELTLQRLLHPDESLTTSYEGFPELIQEQLKGDLHSTDEDAWLTSLWSEFFSHSCMHGQKLGSSLLNRWAQWEKALREQLAAHRLAKPVEQSLEWDHRRLIEAWAAAENPMVGERLLDEARWSFIDRETRSYSFTLDEFVAYVLKLRMLIRFEKLDRALGVKILEEVTKL